MRALPARVLGPGEYLIIWADEQGAQGETHANFKLDAAGETISLAYADTDVIDQVRRLFMGGHEPPGSRIVPCCGD